MLFFLAVGMAVDALPGILISLPIMLTSGWREPRRDTAVSKPAWGGGQPVVTPSVGQFVTGQLMRIDLNTSAVAILDAWHPFPLRLRDGRVEEIELDIDLPFGIRSGRSFRVPKFPIAPGDRIVFVTDGMLERNVAEVDVPDALGDTGDLHPREVVYALGAAVMRANRGEAP
jgi:hypothetical protein